MRYADSLPEALYSADSVRAMDRYLIDQQGVDGFELMQSAARGAFRQLLRHWPSPASILVLCGAGNNGGDGYLIALNAHKQGIPVQCVSVSPAGKLSGDALKAFKAAEDAVIREQWVGAMMTRLVGEELSKCYVREGVNHLENCGELRGQFGPIGCLDGTLRRHLSRNACC